MCGKHTVGGTKETQLVRSRQHNRQHGGNTLRVKYLFARTPLSTTNAPVIVHRKHFTCLNVFDACFEHTAFASAALHPLRAMPTSGIASFVGAELEAAVALTSVLRTESALGAAKADATLAAAGAGEKPGDFENPSALSGAQLPLPALVAAARLLRLIGRTAVRALDSLPAIGARAGARVGRASAVRLTRYLTQQCDK